MGPDRGPNCDSVLDGVTVVRYGQPFKCPVCQTELLVPKFWSLIVFGLGMAFALCFAIIQTPFAGSGAPNQVHGVLLHAITGTELPRVRTAL